MLRTFFLILFYQVSLFAQEIKLSGTIKDNHNRSIESASVVVMDGTENTLAYSYSDENGIYIIAFDRPIEKTITILVSSLGYAKQQIKIDIGSGTAIVQSFILEEKEEILNEVVIEANQKIIINRDTTTIKVETFGNKTEQTVEDILKKLPGIQVLKDGSIKAHGKNISKLLIEGEDLFDQNYKLLSKNLDAKVLDAVQILEAYEENPILKTLNSSDKVALNLKLKKDKQNIWFGNITAGAGVFSENRWKEAINLGLLKKKIKLFYLGDYNNLGEKATDQVSKSITENNFFGEDRYEKTAKTLYNISSNENTSFSKSQSIFDKALFNSLSFTTKIKPTLTLRGVGYFANDNQTQNSFSQTQYNIENNPVSFTESNDYNGKKTLSSGELELKYYVNEDNYMTNLFIYKNNTSDITDQLYYNDTLINQSSNLKNQTFYNHFNHSYKISDNKILHNYIYFGSDKINQNTNISSPFLNALLKANPDAIDVQIANNNVLFYGIKSKLITRFAKFTYTLGFQYEYNKEVLNSNFFVDNAKQSEYENFTQLNQSFFTIENILRYNFSEKVNLTGSFNFCQNQFNTNLTQNNISIFNPQISLNIRKTGFGNFIFSYENNNNTPEINYLTTQFQLTDYKSFMKGNTFEGLLQNDVLSFSYNLFKDDKRFSLSTDFIYTKSKNIYNSENIVTDNFNFLKYVAADGGNNYSGTFSLVNYFRKIKLASKLSTNQNWNDTPTKVNSIDFINLKSYTSSYTFSATTYYKLPVNFDFGVNYNYFQTFFDTLLTKNKTLDEFINCNYNISKTWLAELNGTFYQMNNQNYSFINAIINYNPKESKFSYRLILNNLTNENEFTLVTLSNYTSYKSTINLVPRYLLATIKYRF